MCSQAYLWNGSFLISLGFTSISFGDRCTTQRFTVPQFGEDSKSEDSLFIDCPLT